MPALPPDVRVAIDVQKFDASLETGVAVDTLWSVRPGTGEARIGRSAAGGDARDDDEQPCGEREPRRACERRLPCLRVSPS